MPLLHIGREGDRALRVDADLIATGRTCVLGASGSGKSYSVGVICEELCKNKVPFLLVDTEGEHSGLKERYEVIWIGDEEECDLTWSGLDLDRLAGHAPDIAPLILDLSETDDPKSKVGALLTSLYKEISRRKTPYLVVLEEADRFAPQSGEKVKIFEEVARRGRKRGLGLMVCTQRPSLVDKNILSQCSNQLIGRLVIKNDLQSVSQFFPGRGLPNQLTTLSPGVFYAMGDLSSEPTKIQIRKRRTRHGGITPRLMKRVIKPSSTVLDELRGAKVETRLLGLPVVIAAEDLPSLVKKERSTFLFGRKEIVTSVSLVWRPLVEIGVRVRTGWLRKRFETVFLTLDGVTGRFVELNGSLVFREGLKRFLGLTAQHIEILQTLRPEQDLSLIELAGKIGLSEGALRKPMKLLEQRRLVRPSKIGRAKVYRRLVDPPRIEFKELAVNLEHVQTASAKVDDIKIKEPEIREILWGLFEGSDLEHFMPFLYPMYRVKFALGRRTRSIWVDARTGKGVEF